ncbi:MAG: hypothetical protein QNJ29_14620 [Rhizobiaceae bacterium]|nr:hypothetical protein [Rhizobiaceae bacterium]
MQNRNPVSSGGGYLYLIFTGFVLGVLPALLNFFVDPYELFFEKNRSGRIAEIAEKAHYPLWKLGRYVPGKFETIVLGDSRARALRDKYWNSFEFSSVKNLAYGGGTIPEIYETFKLIKDDPAVKNLVIGIQLRSFDEDHKQGMNRVPEAVSLIHAPEKYLFNWSIAKTSLKVAEAEYSAVRHLSEFAVSKAKASDKDAFSGLGENRTLLDLLGETSQLETNRILPQKFARQISRNARSDWRGFEFSETYWSFIEDIGQWAKSNRKNLLFVIPPTIAEMKQTIEDYGHRNLDEMLRKRLARLGPVLDFDFPSRLTADLDHFTDAYHFNALIARQIVGEAVAALSSDTVVLSRVMKRRKLIHCTGEGQTFSQPAAGQQLVMGSGRNCRVWRGVAS